MQEAFHYSGKMIPVAFSKEHSGCSSESGQHGGKKAQEQTARGGRWQEVCSRGPCGGGKPAPVPARDHNRPLVTNLPAQPPLSSKHPFHKYLRTHDSVRGTMLGARDRATRKITVLPSQGPHPPGEKGTADDKHDAQV